MPSPDDRAPDAPGEGEFTAWKRSDLRLARRAARCRWGVPDDLQGEAIFQAAKVLTTTDQNRDKLAAIKLLVEMSKVDQKDDMLAAKDKGDRATAEDAIREMMAAGDTYRPEGGDRPGTGGVPDATGPVQ